MRDGYAGKLSLRLRVRLSDVSQVEVYTQNQERWPKSHYQTLASSPNCWRLRQNIVLAVVVIALDHQPGFLVWLCFFALDLVCHTGLENPLSAVQCAIKFDKREHIATNEVADLCVV